MAKSSDRQGARELLTLVELSAYLKIAERTAYGWVKEGKVPGFKVGKAWRFDRADIDRWLDEQKRKCEIQG